VLDLFDIVVTHIFIDAQKAGREAGMRGLRDLDAAALTLRQGWACCWSRVRATRARRRSPRCRAR